MPGRLSLVYERTERRGPIFDRLRNDVSMIAALTECRIVQLPQTSTGSRTSADCGRRTLSRTRTQRPRHCELCARLSRCSDIDTGASRSTVSRICWGTSTRNCCSSTRTDEAVHDRQPATRIRRRAEVEVGGVVGRAASQCVPVVVGDRPTHQHAHSVRRSFRRRRYRAWSRDSDGRSRPAASDGRAALALGQLEFPAEDEQSERFTQRDASIMTSLPRSSPVPSRRCAGSANRRTVETGNAAGRHESDCNCVPDISQSTAARSSMATSIKGVAELHGRCCDSSRRKAAPSSPTAKSARLDTGSARLPTTSKAG
jgi:hypothetical protein